MKDIIKKFPPPEEKIHKIFPSHPQKVFDLHGYTRDEVDGKILWILEYAKEKFFHRIRIVTGVGKNILFTASKKALQKYTQKFSILHIEEKTGVVEVYL